MTVSLSKGEKISLKKEGDGGGLKNTLENKAPAFLDEKIGDYIKERGRKVFVTLGVDRWGLSKSFVEAGYEVVASPTLRRRVVRRRLGSHS